MSRRTSEGRTYDGVGEGSRIEGVHVKVGSRSVDELAAERDVVPPALLELRTKAGKAKGP
jgi:hypothetical protein